MAEDDRALTKAQEIAVALGRQPEDELDELARKVAGQFMGIADVVGEHLFDDEDELAKLPPRKRRMVDYARMNDKEAPIGLKYALRFAEATGRRESRRSVHKTNITYNDNRPQVTLPRRMEPDELGPIKVIEARALRDEDDEE